MPTPVRGQVRVGIIGAGLIGQNHSMMLRYVADCTEQSVRVVSVADVSHLAAERLAARWHGAKALESADEIIADPSIDAVWICTPTAIHRQVCVGAARAGKHIFCEKPLAMNSAEAAQMENEISLAGVLSQVGLVLRLSPVYTVIRDLLRDPDRQAPHRHDARRSGLPDPWRHDSAWRNDPLLTAGGTLIEHSVHDFDLFTWIFGPVIRLSCRSETSTAPGGRGLWRHRDGI